MENRITLNGKQTFMGKEIPVILGGFGPDKKCICDKTVAEIHGMETRHVRELINRNIVRFREEIDYIDLKKAVVQNDDFTICSQIGYSRMEITKAEHIYILSERGYSKLIKIMDTDLAWDIHDRIMDEYFELREQALPPQSDPIAQLDAQARRMRAEAMALNAKTNAAKMLLEAYSEAGVSPEYKVLALRDVYAPAGINVPLEGVRAQPKTYDATSIAEMLGVYSAGGRAHAQAVSALIELVGVKDGESIRVPCQGSNGHADSTLQFTGAVVERLREWLRVRGYPAKIVKADGSKAYTVVYRTAS